MGEDGERFCCKGEDGEVLAAKRAGGFPYYKTNLLFQI